MKDYIVLIPLAMLLGFLGYYCYHKFFKSNKVRSHSNLSKEILQKQIFYLEKDLDELTCMVENNLFLESSYNKCVDNVATTIVSIKDSVNKL